MKQKKSAKRASRKHSKIKVVKQKKSLLKAPIEYKEQGVMTLPQQRVEVSHQISESKEKTYFSEDFIKGILVGIILTIALVIIYVMVFM